MNSDRLEISRLFHRFGFGPKPGEFAAALKAGIPATRQNLLNPVKTSTVADPVITDLGPYPLINTQARADFSAAMQKQRRDLVLWWLDKMVLTDDVLNERMTWFWHGHWATSIGKVEYALPMFIQNQTLRENALGNFTKQARLMMMDGALQFWLDGGDNVAGSPNENLAREFMELFTLGVNRYSESDIKEVARGLTGYRIQRSNGKVTLNAKTHDSQSLTFLGTSGSYDAVSISDFLVSRDDCALFIAERIWYRFVSDTIALPTQSPIKDAFKERDILATVKETINGGYLANPAHEMVKSPVDWFVAVCRALNLTPSKLRKPEIVINFLDKLGQVPFIPPNVGGWPSGEFWLTASSAQYRLQFAQSLIQQADMGFLKAIQPSLRYSFLADHLGVAAFSLRTQRALRDASGDPSRVFLLAISTPEYIVNA